MLHLSALLSLRTRNNQFERSPRSSRVINNDIMKSGEQKPSGRSRLDGKPTLFQFVIWTKLSNSRREKNTIAKIEMIEHCKLHKYFPDKTDWPNIKRQKGAKCCFISGSKAIRVSFKFDIHRSVKLRMSMITRTGFDAYLVSDTHWSTVSSRHLGNYLLLSYLSFTRAQVFHARLKILKIVFEKFSCTNALFT